MASKICKPEYLAKALLLTTEEQERLLSRMTGKLPRRLAKEKLGVDEALAIQLEIEDEQLAEWREKMHSIKAGEKAKQPKKTVKAKPEQAVPKPAAAPMPAAAPKSATAVAEKEKPKVASKPRSAARTKAAAKSVK